MDVHGSRTPSTHDLLVELAGWGRRGGRVAPRRRAGGDRRVLEGMPRLGYKFGRTAFELWRWGSEDQAAAGVAGAVVLRMHLSTALLRFGQARRARGRRKAELVRRAERSAELALGMVGRA